MSPTRPRRGPRPPPRGPRAARSTRSRCASLIVVDVGATQLGGPALPGQLADRPRVGQPQPRRRGQPVEQPSGEVGARGPRVGGCNDSARPVVPGASKYTIAVSASMPLRGERRARPEDGVPSRVGQVAGRRRRGDGSAAGRGRAHGPGAAASGRAAGSGASIAAYGTSTVSAGTRSSTSASAACRQQVGRAVARPLAERVEPPPADPGELAGQRAGAGVADQRGEVGVGVGPRQRRGGRTRPATSRRRWSSTFEARAARSSASTPRGSSAPPSTRRVRTNPSARSRRSSSRWTGGASTHRRVGTARSRARSRASRRPPGRSAASTSAG